MPMKGVPAPSWYGFGANVVPSSGPGPHSRRRPSQNEVVRTILQNILSLHTDYLKNVWLWRGQYGFADLVPAMHSRMLATVEPEPCEESVRLATNQLLRYARSCQLDRIEGVVLPDLALLAYLQHHGAATPLIDVSVDPLVAIWMAVNPGSLATEGVPDHGYVFAIAAPRLEVASMDARPYWDPHCGSTSVADQLESAMLWYKAPDISPRLRVQRGSFLLGSFLRPPKDKGSTTLIGQPSRQKTAPQPAPAPTPQPSQPSQPGIMNQVTGTANPRGRRLADGTMVRFEIPRAYFKPMNRWLEKRIGLTHASVFPVPWHSPMIEEFAQCFGRNRPIDFS